MSDGKQCLLYMVKIPYMEAGIVIMTDFSIVDIFWTAPFREPVRKKIRDFLGVFPKCRKKFKGLFCVLGPK